MKHRYFIAWWNVENLFDVAASAQRPDWLRKKLSAELRGWDETVLSRKIDNLASVIRKMNNGQGPDILGVCEIENRPVLEKLRDALTVLGKNYGIVHYEMNDQRGIDVAFIYDRDKFTFKQSFSHVILKRTATRDLFQVNFTTHKNNDLILIGNHWPARSAGILESEPYRIIAGETLSYWMERIFEIKGDDIAVIAMGDFNDEPFSRSVREYARGINSVKKVVYAKSPRLFNLMWPLLAGGKGTYYYNNFPFVFDQMMVSKSLVKATGKLKIRRDGNGIFPAKVEMIPLMVSGGRYPTPVAYGRPSKKKTYNPNGYSDHFPVSVIIEE